MALLKTSAQASILALLVLAVQYLFRWQLPPRWKYALWLLVVARLLIPALPESSFSLQRVVRPLAPQIYPAISPSLFPPPTVEDTAPKMEILSAAQAKTGVAWGKTFLSIGAVVWLVGILCISGRMLFGHGRFLWSLRRVPACHGPLPDLLSSAARELRLRRRIRLVETSLVATPAIGGFFRPTLLLPMGFANSFSREEIRMIFLHELAHIRRGDLWMDLLFSALQIIHWFNPILWLAFVRMRFDRECATDSLVLSGERAQLKSTYGKTLLKLLESISHPAPRPGLLGVLEDRRHLHDRFRWISRATSGAYGWSVLGLFLFLALAAVGLTQTSSGAPESASAEAAPASASLPPLGSSPTKEQARAYVQAILKEVPPSTNTSLRDPQIAALKKVGSDNIDVLIDEEERINFPKLQNVTANYYLSMAVCDLARPQDRDIVVRALPKNHYLVYTILKRNWSQDAREELLRVFREKSGNFPPGWIEAVAALHDPSTYDELKNYLIYGRGREYTYDALKKIPDLGDLKDTVEKAWPVAKAAGGYDLHDMAKIAAQYGVADAKAYLESHPAPTEAKALASIADARRKTSGVEAAMVGSRLSPAQVDQLTKEIEGQPDDMRLRMTVLGYYFTKRTTQPSARDASQPHILWIIAHQPDSYEAGLPYVQVNKIIDPMHYAEARTAWERQIAANPDKADVLGNAANFLQLGDPQAAEKLLQRALALEPAESRWSERLAAFYSLQSGKGSSSLFPNASQDAFHAYQAALKGQEGAKRFYLLTALPKAAYKAGDDQAARTYARELLDLSPAFQGDWNYGNAIYSANSILGLVALRAGDVTGAGNFLLAAGATPGSPQLDSFGPDFTLAKQLLDQGQRETVIAFLGKVSTFWKGEQSTLAQWQDAIQKGEHPKLNLFGQ